MSREAQLGRSAAVWFFIKFLVVFCALVFPRWSSLGRAYSAAYCVLGNWFLDSFGDDGVVEYETIKSVRERIARHREVQESLRQKLGREPAVADIAMAQRIPQKLVERDVTTSQELDAARRDEDWDVVMHLAHVDVDQEQSSPVVHIRDTDRRIKAYVANVGSSRFKGFVPTAFVASLILATPVPWRRRLKALLGALLLVSVFVGLRLYVFLVYIFTLPPERLPNQARLAVYDPGDFIRTIINYLVWVLDTSFAGCFVLAGCIWFLATFRRSDWAQMLGPRAADQTELGEVRGQAP